MGWLLKASWTRGYKGNARKCVMYSTNLWQATLEAWELLFKTPGGLIDSGEVWSRVEGFMSWNPNAPNSPIGFSRDQAINMLYYGKYKIRWPGPFRAPKLVIVKGPVPSIERDNGMAEIGGNVMWINFWTHRRTVRDRRNAIGMSKAQAVDVLTYNIAATILHEVMHLQGFEHMSRDSAVNSAYRRTLPEVAERAVKESSGYWGAAGSGAFYTPEDTNPMFLAPCGNEQEKSYVLNKELSDQKLPLTESGYYQHLLDTEADEEKNSL